MTASQFVLVYDIRAGQLAHVERFDDPHAAADAVIQLEKHHAGDAHIHVVMLAGESLESIKATHGTYFRDASDLLGSLAAAAA
jgi:hypothetical protein